MTKLDNVSAELDGLKSDIAAHNGRLAEIGTDIDALLVLVQAGAGSGLDDAAVAEVLAKVQGIRADVNAETNTLDNLAAKS